MWLEDDISAYIFWKQEFSKSYIDLKMREIFEELRYLMPFFIKKKFWKKKICEGYDENAVSERRTQN